MNNTLLRLFVISVLDDQHGINQDALDKLYDLNDDASLTDILGHVESSEGRFYLPEDHGLVA